MRDADRGDASEVASARRTQLVACQEPFCNWSVLEHVAIQYWGGAGWNFTRFSDGIMSRRRTFPAVLMSWTKGN